MAAENQTIVVKRIKKASHGHHGGAWKIAYADFVTAMMAFFLLMWLMGTISAGDLKGVEEYFKTPLKVALMGGPAVGGSQSVLKGGGKDLTEKAGQVRKSEGKESIKKDVKKIDIKSAEAELEKQEKQKLQDLKAKLQTAIDASTTMRQFKNQLLLDITTEGLRIQIVDDQNRPMFNSSKAELQPYAKQILHEVGQVLNGLPNKISLSGHTDASPYPNGEKQYSNWELSSDRANAARRELVAGGIDESKLLRVVGLSSAVLFDKANPLNPINRRISIIVMNKKAEEEALNDDSAIKVDSNSAPDVGELPQMTGK